MTNNSVAQKIAITGATGFVGSYLAKAFHRHKWDVVPLGRDDFKQGHEVFAGKIKEVDIIVNLAGAPVVGRWTEKYKKTMYESRIYVTRKLVNALSVMDKKPELLISTSAIGYYSPDGTHTEDNYKQANDFLGDLAKDWESEALKAREIGIRTVIFRFGIVLGKNGGALKKMLLPFKLGLGGTIGNGDQAFSWIHIKDLKHAFETAITNVSFEGIYNLTSPNPSTNKGLTKALGKALSRPTLLSIPKFALQLQLGEGARVLASGQRVIPKRLLESGFKFHFKDIEAAVKDCVS